MSILNYEIVNPVIDSNSPHYDTKFGQFVVPIKDGTNYKYVLECALYDDKIDNKRFYLLFGTNKFDENAKRCYMTHKRQYTINVLGEFKFYLEQENKCRSNFEMNLIKQEDDYDVYEII